MEQFLNAGFDRESSIKMLHSVMLLKDGNCFSTMDLAAVNLYTGECELLKVGAAATFLKRGDWVETVSSTSMPMGIIGEADYECTKKQLRPGDFLIMVSDGILDAFPGIMERTGFRKSFCRKRRKMLPKWQRISWKKS